MITQREDSKANMTIQELLNYILEYNGCQIHQMNTFLYENLQNGKIRAPETATLLASLKPKFTTIPARGFKHVTGLLTNSLMKNVISSEHDLLVLKLSTLKEELWNQNQLFLCNMICRIVTSFAFRHLKINKTSIIAKQ